MHAEANLGYAPAHAETTLRFVPLVRIGEIRIGVAPAWLPAQAIGLLAFGAFAYATVAGHLGESIGALGSLRVGLVLLLALDLTVLVHEAGHAVAATLAGVSVRAVVLVAYGGATIREATASRDVARWTALGGPLANVLAALLCALGALLAEPNGFIATLLMLAGVLQALNGLTNLLPFSRLDGSRIFTR